MHSNRILFIVNPNKKTEIQNKYNNKLTILYHYNNSNLILFQLYLLPYLSPLPKERKEQP